MSIVPRWEWRTFEAVSPSVADHLLAQEPLQVQTKDEVYVLSPTSEASAKIRDDRLEVKCLEERDASGLELWRPVLSAVFPLQAAIVGEALQLLHVPVSSSLADAADLAAFLDACLAQGPRLRAVRVHKSRILYRLGACRAEITDVSADGRSLRTLAVESESPQAVVAELNLMGLVGRPNQNYPATLKALIGMPRFPG
jgi:exopolyphosphatase/guanosine-5'-triphosphate,3'-diphosphate pyrophosphatase